MLVATPGQLARHLAAGNIDLSACRCRYANCLVLRFVSTSVLCGHTSKWLSLVAWTELACVWHACMSGFHVCKMSLLKKQDMYGVHA